MAALRLLRTSAVVATLIAAVAYAADPASRPAAKLEYNRDVRPILAENCFSCHGADSAARKAKLRLDDREAALAREAFVPGKPAESELVDRLFRAADDEQRMPPAKSHKELKPSQKEILKRWIAEGAEYQPHWAFIPPKAPAIPQVGRGENSAGPNRWPRNPIDRFILAKLNETGLTPAPEADRRTLARRLALDLTGLPPTPAQVEAFVNDKSPTYYETYVDALMATPQWGEHRGRAWLDAARYGDTHGIHFDNFREMWVYRDWVINALNANMPFDKFTTEQLAGDLLPNATLDQKIATGFNRCNITSNEGGAINEEYLVLYTRDRTETVNQVWMGLTAGCAVCHDHKFDPLSQKDFYAMAAFFNNTTQAAMDGNIPNTPPSIAVPRPEDRKAWESLQTKLDTAKAKLEARKTAAKPEFETWLKTATPAAAEQAMTTEALAYFAWFNEGAGTTAHAIDAGKPRTLILPEGSEWKPGPQSAKAATLKPPTGKLAIPGIADFDSKQAFSFGAWVQIPSRGQTGGIIAKMDAKTEHRGWDLYLANDRVAVHIINSWPANALKVSTKVPVDPNKWRHVFATYDGSGKAAGVNIYFDGEPQPLEIDNDTLNGTIRTPAPLTIGHRVNGEAVKLMSIQDLRIYTRSLTSAEVAAIARAAKAADILLKPKRSPEESTALFDWYLAASDPAAKALDAEISGIRKEETTIRARGTVAHISVEKTTPPEAFILNRGEYDQRKAKVAPGTPAALPPLPPEAPRNRLGFAQWLLRPDHPLTSRVTVNRFWQELYGTGLVKTSGDFGVTGDAPSHPELLDWLALDFQKDWDVKRFFKLLVSSATYRQSAATTPQKQEFDPANRLLAHGPRYRMDAEMVRDYALAASGLLVAKIGGASVRPYQPIGVWEAVAMPGSNTRFYKPETGENLYRRSMYTLWKRAAPPAAMEVLNAPNRETCTVRRERTNTPLQALLTLNDVQFIEAARVLAEVTLTSAKTDDDRVQFLANRVLARPFRDAESAVVKESLATLMAAYAAKPDEAKKLLAVGERKPDATLDPALLAAWTMLANEILNLDEVLNK